MEQLDCIFCKIINKEIPSAIFYETNEIVAFLNINPVNPGHYLILPKKHSINILDTDDHLLADMAVAVKKLTPIILELVKAPAFNLVVNNGTEAGQVVFHSHWHVVPRFDADGLEHWKGTPAISEELVVLADKIKNKI